MSQKIIIPKQLDSIDQGNYYWFANGFNDEEIDRIHKHADNLSYIKSGIFRNHSVEEVRRSKLKWLYHNKECEWLYKKIFDLANQANEATFKFRLHYVEDAIQYTLYEANSAGKYDWHIDIGKGKNSLRKLSAILLLTDPSEFEGGILQIFTSVQPEDIPLKKGSIVFFPSFFLHRVTEVTKGNRQTLVIWLGGDHYI